MKEVRVAIIGTGMISHRHMVIYENIRRRSAELGFTAKVVACAEIDDVKRRQWAGRYGLDEKDTYKNYRDMLKRSDIDTVDVCVHNNLHTPIAIEVMKAGFDCYCEKPEAASYADARLMIDCAKKLGRKFHVQVSSVMTPQTRVARSMVENGTLGGVYYVNLETLTQRRRPGYDAAAYGFTTDFYSQKAAGHGPSVDGGVYFIGQILHILGLPKLQSVNGFAKTAMPIDRRLLRNGAEFGVEDICQGLAKFENGTAFHFLTASACNYRDYTMTYLLGPKGGLEILAQDTGGGKMARPGGRGRSWNGEPELRFFGEHSGRDVSIDLRCDANGLVEEITDPTSLYYNDNQSMWLAYKLGILTDETRYNTPEIAAQQLLFTDGIFLSEELHRSVTAEEIEAMSPSLYMREQDIGTEVLHFDTQF